MKKEKEEANGMLLDLSGFNDKIRAKYVYEKDSEDFDFWSLSSSRLI